MDRVFEIEEFGAKPDISELSTTAIQKAIDACHREGGGTVLCTPGTFLTGTLELRSNVELHLAAGCRLVASTDLSHYQQFSCEGFHPEHAPEGCTEHLIRAVDAHRVAITGPGEINGSGLSFYDTSATPAGGRFFSKPQTPRPRMVMMCRCRDVRLEETSFVDSPCWTFWLMRCEDVSVRGIRVIGDQRMINNDGLDLDSCRNVVVSDCLFRTGDDCIVLRSISQMFDEPSACEQIAVTNCVLDSWCQGVRVGCPGDGVIRNAVFSNLVIVSSGNGILFEFPKRYLPADGKAGADVGEISFSHIVMRCAGAPVKVAVEEGIRLARLENLSFSHFSIRSGGPIIIEGSSQTPVRDVRCADISLETAGAETVVCRHCERVTMSGVDISNRQAASAGT